MFCTIQAAQAATIQVHYRQQGWLLWDALFAGLLANTQIKR